MRTIRCFLLAVIAAAAVAAVVGGCGSVRTEMPPAGDDGGASDAAADPPPDAPPGPPPPPPPPPPPGNARELAVAAGRVGDSRFVLELEISGGVTAARTASGSHRLDVTNTVTVTRGGN